MAKPSKKVGAQPRQSRPANRREQILDVAEAHFARLGFGATRLQGIADDVQIRVASLYNHFAGKDELYAAVLEQALAPARELLISALEGGTNTDTNAGNPQTTPLMVPFADLYASHPAIVHLFKHEMLRGESGMHPLMHEWLEELSHAGRAHLEQLYVGPGRWNKDDIPLIQLALYNTVAGFFTAAPLHRLLTGRDVSSPDSIAQQRDFLRRVERAFIAFTEPNAGEIRSLRDTDPPHSISRSNRP